MNKTTSNLKLDKVQVGLDGKFVEGGLVTGIGINKKYVYTCDICGQRGLSKIMTRFDVRDTSDTMPRSTIAIGIVATRPLYHHRKKECTVKWEQKYEWDRIEGDWKLRPKLD